MGTSASHDLIFIRLLRLRGTGCTPYATMSAGHQLILKIARLHPREVVSFLQLQRHGLQLSLQGGYKYNVGIHIEYCTVIPVLGLK